MSLGEKAITGVAWSAVQQFGGRIISFSINLILARLLMPKDFGTISVFGVFMAIGSTLISSGLANSLIRTKDTDDSDYSTVFYFNFIVSCAVYLILFSFSPAIAHFFKMPELVSIIRVYSITLMIGALSTVQGTLFTKKLDFKTPMLISIPTSIIAGICGIIMAYIGWGVWSLVYMSIISSVVSTLLYWYHSDWRPKKIFSKEKFRYHFSFGSRLAASTLLDTFYNNIYTLVIGKKFDATQLGYYGKANGMYLFPVSIISGPLNNVTYPLFAEIKNDNRRLKNVYRKIMKAVIFLAAPMQMLIAVLGEPLFRFLFTEKWLPAVPMFQILCLVGLLFPIHAYNLNVLLVKGRSDLFFRLEVVKKVIITIVLIVSVNFGIYGIIWGKVFTSIAALFINCYYSGKYLNYNLFQQMRDISPGVIISMFIGIVIYLIDQNLSISFSDFTRLISGGVLCTIMYAAISYLLKLEEIGYIKELSLWQRNKLYRQTNE